MKTNTWLENFDFELESRGLSAAQRAEILVETESFITESSGDPIEHFGLPAEYALAVISALDITIERQPRDELALSLSNIQKSYKANTVLHDMSLELRQGEVAALIGPNGAGKTTLLKIAAGLVQADSGTVTAVDPIGYCPQEGGLNPNLRPNEHFELFGLGAGLDRKRSIDTGHVIARQLGWSVPDKTTAGELSGGTAQKLRVVLSMMSQPNLLLLDEPYQGFDTQSIQKFWSMLWDWRDQGKSAVVSSHYQDALVRADKIIEVGAPG